MRLYFFVYSCILVLLSGCAPQTVNTGREFSVAAASQIVIGKSTRDSVKAALGGPESNYVQGNGEELWMYSYSQGETGGVGPSALLPWNYVGAVVNANTVTSTSSSLQISFQRGTVKSCVMSIMDTRTMNMKQTECSNLNKP